MHEGTEKQTPKAGYVLLIAMFAASLFFGWRALDDLNDVPLKPERLSHCASPYVTYRWEDWGRFEPYVVSPEPRSVELYAPPEKGYPAGGECVYAAIEIAHGIPAVFEKRRALDTELFEIGRELGEARHALYQLEHEYDLSLQEMQAGVTRGVYFAPELKQKVSELRPKVATLEMREKAIRDSLTPFDNELREKYSALLKEYRSQWRWYEFKIFLLEVLFVFPFFVLVLWWYLKLLARSSPYTIIFTVLLGVASVLLLRVLIGWFWSLFLARLIQALWEFMQRFALLESLIFYGGMILSIALFGGAVYMVQKRIFDPRRVAARRLRKNQCPNCETTLDLAENFCPNCGHRISEKCTACGNDRFVDLGVCPHCGVKNKNK